MIDEQRVRKLIWDRVAEMLGVTISAVLSGGTSAKFLRGDWAWATPPNAIAAGASGYMTGADKTKLDGLPSLAPTPLFNNFADVGNSGTSETDLVSNTTAAGQLGSNGAKLKAEYGGVFVSSGTATRQVKIYFGGTAIFDTGALTLSLSAAWTIYVTVIRVSATVVRYMISMTTEGAALAAYTATGELTGLTLANTNILKITGTAAGVGAASNDIVSKISNVFFEPAAP